MLKWQWVKKKVLGLTIGGGGRVGFRPGCRGAEAGCGWGGLAELLLLLLLGV